jgi:hypothetical protein
MLQRSDVRGFVAPQGRGRATTAADAALRKKTVSVGFT